MSIQTLRHALYLSGYEVVRAAGECYGGVVEAVVRRGDGETVSLRHYDSRWAPGAHFSALADVDGDPVNVRTDDRRLGEPVADHYLARLRSAVEAA